jgi:hypothetical protein
LPKKVENSEEEVAQNYGEGARCAENNRLGNRNTDKIMLMSFDLAVWHNPHPVTDAEAGVLYADLCEGRIGGVTPHPSVAAFYAELTAHYPEIDTVPDDKIDDLDYCPWSSELDRSGGHLILPCAWSQAEQVSGFVRELAAKHGLAVYDPQQGRIF